jgi:hypothetical protein
VLVIGGGSEQAAHFIPENARQCRIFALDISSENLKLAQAVFWHEGILYRKVDVLHDDIERKVSSDHPAGCL